MLWNLKLIFPIDAPNKEITFLKQTLLIFLDFYTVQYVVIQ